MSDDENSSEEGTSSSSSTSEDEELNEDFLEKDFLKTLSCLKNKDPQIYNKNVQFFPQEEAKLKKEPTKKKDSTEKPIYLRDYERDILIKEVNNEFEEHSDDQGEPPPTMTYNEEQRAIKESFKIIVNEESSEDEENATLLKKKEKDEKEKQQEDKDYIQWLKGKRNDLDDKEIENELKPLHDYWNDPSLDEKEEFLKDYILNKRYLERDAQGNVEESDLSEDEKLLEAQENFEHKYNFRFESEENKTIKRYPRNIEGSMRRKNDSRKRKREEIQKRKKEEKEKKKMEIKKKQKERLSEIQEKLEKLKDITGNVELGFKDDEIMEDFDPDKYDKKMQELYDDKFYSEDVEGKPDFSNIESYDDNWDPEEFNMDCDALEHTEASKETRSKKKRKKKKATAFKDICDIVKPVFDPEKHNTFQKYIDEYYNLDCEDFIDDIPCKFKYREVVPNDFGLSVEEILLADDKELNRWVSSKKICKLRPSHVEKNEVKIYKQKARDEQLKIKLLPSLYQKEEDEVKEEYHEEEQFSAEQSNDQSKKLEENTGQTQQIKKIPKKKNKTNTEDLNNRHNKSKNNLHSTKKFKTKFKKHKSSTNDGTNDIASKISDSRLLAYNIKPRQFRAKLKHTNKKQL